MSIIQEALRKAGKPDAGPEETHDKKTVHPPEIKKTEPDNKSLEPKFIYYTMAGFLFLLLFGIIIVISRSSQSAVIPAAPAKSTKSVILPKIERREETPKSSRKRESIAGFVLNGIMQLVDGPRAIINDIIVGEGEIIGGAKVEKIKKDGVILNYNDSEVALNINR